MKSDRARNSTTYVEVAVPLPLPTTFAYTASADRMAAVRPGVRVQVPFGRGSVVGLAVGFTEKVPESKQLKELGEVLDQEPLLSPQLLELGGWLARYYLAPPGEALRVMLPPGLLARKTPEAQDASRLWPARRQRAIVRAGRPRGDLTPRQAEVLAQLEKLSLPVLVSDFLRQAACSRQLLERLTQQGCAHIETVEVERSPWRRPSAQEVAPHPLTDAQQSVLAEIRALQQQEGFRSLLVHGVTGSGKTEIYLNAIRWELDQGRSALMLVPEIGLTPQVSRLFRGWFGEHVAILHSGLSQGERFDQWRQIREGRRRVVVGTRSAVFAPLQRLGIIIIDEEQDESYKQEEHPRYHGRDTALMRAKLEGAAVVLGSATPQLETYYLAAERGRHRLASIGSRVLERPLPTVHIADMRQEFAKHGAGLILSELLWDFLERTLRNRNQAMILLNRRGYSTSVLCRSCGHTETCENCSITLTHHREFNRLVCHYCGYARSIPEKCRECQREYVFFAGMGTEKVQAHLQARFPHARVDRMDRDTVRRKGSVQRILRRVSRGQTDILVGTQMIAKGHDFAGVTLVGVLAADQGLQIPDFRSAERTFQLLTQVAGRAGRGESPGDVVIQTHYPNHYSLKHACTQDYGAFYSREIEFRKRFRYPPFTALANLVVSGPDRDESRRGAEELAESLKSFRLQHSDLARMRILGPAPAALERLKRDYRHQILIKTTDRRELNQVLRDTLASLDKKKTRQIQVDIDPVRLL